MNTKNCERKQRYIHHFSPRWEALTSDTQAIYRSRGFATLWDSETITDARLQGYALYRKHTYWLGRFRTARAISDSFISFSSSSSKDFIVTSDWSSWRFCTFCISCCFCCDRKINLGATSMTHTSRHIRAHATIISSIAGDMDEKPFDT